ncbi:hypothetical protein [Nocardia sp. NPDC052566]|uniref:hypothetical protein n=1 Tax=Nocardia sp. NPDC052566 TaxID=3364330 RepID=UPI0037C5839E
MNTYDRLRLLVGSPAPGQAVRRWTIDFLTGLLDGRIDLMAIQHPLGFFCFPVWRGTGLGVCLHVWAEGPRAAPTTSPMHAHSWDLVSVVLYGTVGNEIIDVDPAPARPTHRIFEIQSAADGDLVRATSRLASYRIRSCERFRAGETYTLRHGVFHVSDVHGAAATVVLGRDRHGTRDRSLAPLSTTDHWVQRIACTATETRRIAKTTLDHLLAVALPEHLEDRCEQAN